MRKKQARADQMETKGISVSGTLCDEKWRSLKRRYHVWFFLQWIHTNTFLYLIINVKIVSYRDSSDGTGKIARDRPNYETELMHPCALNV